MSLLVSGGACDGFLATKTKGGRAWTLTTAFGDLLFEAEQRFGRRDMSWTPVGVEISDEEGPSVWFPGNRRQISILLGSETRFDTRRALFQLAHEVVHVLSPVTGRGAPTIEEGAATLFADELSNANGWVWHSTGTKYLSAKASVQELLRLDANAISKIRGERPTFSLFDPDLIVRHVPGCPDALAQALCKPF